MSVAPDSAPEPLLAKSKTARATIAAMEEILGKQIPVLDGQGFLRVVDYMGDDGAIVQAARVSYGQGTKHTSQDRGLIRYLLRHRHTTPFEMCEIKLHLKMPIFVARQWLRHRTANVNEYSARYSLVPDEIFKAGVQDLAVQSAVNNQGRGETLPAHEATQLTGEMQQAAENAYALYLRLLNENNQRPDQQGVARELARTVLPLATFTEFYWKCDLHNYLHFVSLRADPHAQKEIRVYAEAMVEILDKWVPLTAEAWHDYVREALTLSGEERTVLRRLLNGEKVAKSETALSAREWRALGKALGYDPESETYPTA